MEKSRGNTISYMESWRASRALRARATITNTGVTVPKDGLQKANAAFRRKTANMNLAAIAIFFDKLCTAILKGLVCPGEGQIGIFGEVSTYFGAVETNGRGMLHLHCLVWLAGNLDFFNLRRKMLNDPSFSSQVADYLDSIISGRGTGGGGTGGTGRGGTHPCHHGNGRN